MMTTPEFGELETVDLRAAWNHEAHGFTPWLAEHLDRLAAVISIPLELEGSEVAVESFSAFSFVGRAGLKTPMSTGVWFPMPSN